MKLSLNVSCAAVAYSLTILAFSPAQALTMPECSAKYKAAQNAGTLNGQKWNDFRKAECGDAATAAAPTTAAPASAEAKPSAAPKPATPATTGPATFPTAIVTPYVQLGASDSRRFTAISDNVYRFTPFELSKAQRDTLHAIDEHIAVDAWLRGIRFYETLIRSL